MSDGHEGDPATLGRKRRSWTLDEKRRIVDESLEDGASLAEVARRHDLRHRALVKIEDMISTPTSSSRGVDSSALRPSSRRTSHRSFP